MVCQENKINKKTIKGYGSAANQIGTYWNSMASTLNSRTLPHVLMEHSDTRVIHSVHLAEEFAVCLLKQIGTLNI